MASNKKVLATLVITTIVLYMLRKRIATALNNTPFALVSDKLFNVIASLEGFIAIPSKHSELHRHEGPWRGYIHHRWIYDIKDGNFLGYPKQCFLEHMGYIDEWTIKNPKQGREELQFFWKDEIKLNVVNNDHLGPTWNAVVGYYKQLVSQ